MEDIDLKLPYEQVDNDYLIKLLELYRDTHKLEYSFKFIGCLESGEIKDLKLESMDRDLFFMTLNDQKNVLQHIIEADLDKKISYHYRFQTFLANDMEMIKEYFKNNNDSLLSYIKEGTLFEEYENGMLLIDYMFLNKKVNSNIINGIYNHNEIIGKILLYDKNLLSSLNGIMLFENKIGEDTVIEYLFKNNMVTKETIESIYNNVEIIDLINKYNRQDLLSYISDSLMGEKYNGATVLDYLLDNNVDIQSYIYSDKNIEVLARRGAYERLATLSEYNLVKKLPSGITVLETLLQHGIFPNETYFSEKTSLKLFIKYKLYSAACQFNFETLMSLATVSETYFEQLLKAHCRGESVPLSKIFTFSDDVDKLAKFYLLLAKYDMMEYVDDLEERDLLRDEGKGCLLDALLKKNKELTINKVIKDRVKEQFNVAMCLKLNGIEQKDIKVDLHSTELLDDYNEVFNSQYEKLELSEEDENLLKQLEGVMLADGKSDKELVGALITSYRYQLYTDNPFGRREIQKIIEMKTNGHGFSIRRDDNNSFYSNMCQAVFLENTNLNTLNHEMGHALFHLLTETKVPEEYTRMVLQIQNDPVILKKVKDYSLKFLEISDRVEALVEDIYMKEYEESIDEEEKENIEKFLVAKREEKTKFYLDKGYPKETLDIIFDNIYSLDEYLKQDRRIKKEELVDSIMRSEYGSFIAVGDVIDAIFSGKFKSRELRDESGRIIRPGYGHGISYYSRGFDWSFDETIANFSSIVKSPLSREIFQMIKEIVGEQYLNLIYNYYEQEISLSTKEFEEEEEEAAGVAIG